MVHIPRLTVFTPSLVLTVTIERRGAEAAELHLHAGGQGLWVARMAAELGADVALCTALGGETGTVIEGLMGGESVELVASPCGNANGAYVHDRRSGERVLVAEIPAAPLSRHESTTCTASRWRARSTARCWCSRALSTPASWMARSTGDSPPTRARTGSSSSPT